VCVRRVWRFTPAGVDIYTLYTLRWNLSFHYFSASGKILIFLCLFPFFFSSCVTPMPPLFPSLRVHPFICFSFICCGKPRRLITNQGSLFPSYSLRCRLRILPLLNSLLSPFLFPFLFLCFILSHLFHLIARDALVSLPISTLALLDCTSMQHTPAA
jgi:hypothetical protein